MKIAVLSLAAILLISCSEDVSKKVVDCAFEGLNVKLNHSEDPTNTKKINYEIKYTGDLKVTSVKWDFGDGSGIAVNGTTASHTYSAVGDYKVKAAVTLQQDDKSTCTSNPEKAISIK